LKSASEQVLALKLEQRPALNLESTPK